MRAHVTVVTPEGFKVVVADSDERGYRARRDMPQTYETEEQAAHVAETMNKRIGVTPVQADAVKLCSMFRPGDYEDVLASLEGAMHKRAMGAR